MNVDKALAKFSIFSKMLDGGDTGRRRVEHRNFVQLRLTQYIAGNGLEVFMITFQNHLLPFNIFL